MGQESFLMRNGGVDGRIGNYGADGEDVTIFQRVRYKCSRSATDWFVVRLSSHASAALRCTRFIRRVVASATGREDEQ